MTRNLHAFMSALQTHAIKGLALCVSPRYARLAARIWQRAAYLAYLVQPVNLWLSSHKTALINRTRLFRLGPTDVCQFYLYVQPATHGSCHSVSAARLCEATSLKVYRDGAA